MNNFQVAHLWANQAKQSARGSNFYFDGPALFSYGGHFCVARFVTNKRGKKAVLLNADSSSINTSRHQSYARRALRDDIPRFFVPGASPRHEDNRARYRDRLTAAMARIPTRRNAQKINSDLCDARMAATDYNEYSTFFQLRGRLKAPTLPAADAARLARYQANDAKRAAAYEAGRPERERIEREREAARLLEAAERDKQGRQDFRDGKPRAFGIGGPCMLRYAQGSGNFETSQGANVPRGDGMAMLQHIGQVLRAGNLPRVYGENAPRAGGFTLREITAEHVRIGCHVIPLSECALMAAEFAIEWPSVPA